jgi:SHS2 domain-containing protein
VPTVRRLLAHTADLRAELAAPDLAGLHAEAVALVRETLVGSSPVAAREERRFARAGEDEAERFFRFVRELVYLFDAEGFVPAAARLEGDDAVVAGERFDPLRHVFERQIKALTRHRFRLERGPDGVRAELVFDL